MSRSRVRVSLSAFLFCPNYLTSDSHYNFCRLTKIVSSANKFAYGYVSFGLPVLTNISCRVFAIGFFILSKLSSADSHYNFCRLTKIVSSVNKFAYGYVMFGLPVLTNISCRVFAIGFFIICHCERSTLPRKTIKYCFSRG